MCAEALSQAEIDALLRGEAPPPGPSAITAEEEDMVKQYARVVSECGSDVLTTLLGESVALRFDDFKEIDAASIQNEIPGILVAAELSHKGMIQGKILLVLTEENALKLTSQMTGGGAGHEFGDLEESALSEAIQSLFNAANAQLAQQLGGDIILEAPEIIARPPQLADLLPASPDRCLLLTYPLESSSISGKIYQIIPRNFLHSIINAASSGLRIPLETPEDRGAKSQSASVRAKPAQFAPFSGTGDIHGPGAPPVDISNLNLILDISLEVTVELGRTHRKIREVLELGPGSVVELDKLAGEPVDVLVNDKLFAKGEVVVIDENFGVRITDILTIEERIEALK
ncbi:MAG TPA: flagellar motor switch protein FliN [bacterium]|nr:flagellar motor switch protein FliN [Candidatus Omnitrophota bacterium]HOL93498.1 flagellar motor switch protein FliN [bacterium]HXK92551.1 flagellar motor switch protein FliN [bacterium]